MLGCVFEWDFGGKYFAGDFCEDFDIGVDDGGPEVWRGGDLSEIEFFVGANKHDAAEEAGADVVCMPGAIGGGLAGHCKWEELAL